MPENAASLPDFTRWPSFPFEGDMRVKDLAPPVAVEPPRSGEDASDCVACNTPDDAYIWENERWRVRAMDRPTGLPMVLILECRSHLDMGDLPNLLAAELGVMTVRLERAIRSLDGVARVHVNRWGDGSAHLHMWFLARPYGRLQLRGTFLSLWDDILPTIPEDQWRENLALVAAWLAEFGGHANAEPAHIQWQSPSTFSVAPLATGPGTEYASASSTEPAEAMPADPAMDESTPGAFAGADAARTSDPDANDDLLMDVGHELTDDSSRSVSRADSLAGSGSDHGRSSASEDGTAARTSEAFLDADASSATITADAATGSEDASRHPSETERSASAWVADADKGPWRPNDLAEAERPVPGADPSSVVGATIDNASDHQAPPHRAGADSVAGDEQGPKQDGPSVPAALMPGTDAESREDSATAGEGVETGDGQTDASAETAGTRRS